MSMPKKKRIDTSTLAVEIQDTESWPPDFRHAVLAHRDLILSYQRERLRIDRLGYDDIFVRINPPKNAHKKAYSSLVERLELDLTRHKLLAYHCTRLTPREVSGITQSGLRLLSHELVAHRFDQCVADGHLSSSDRDYLLGGEPLRGSLGNRHGHRTGMIWFCPNRSTLQQSSGVYRLFRSWGGEAVYAGHEEDAKIAHILRCIGTPCIVKCVIPFSRAVQFYQNFTERFFAQFVSHEFDGCEPGPRFDLNTKEDVPASDVLEIIQFSDPQFEALTHYSSWGARYRII